jgi:isoleucyl-tRNA synthetase
VIVTQTPRTGWTVAAEGGETVGIEVDITPELRREGLAREVIRLIQDARKSDGLHVSDRITVHWEASDPGLAAALTEHGQLIAGEVLADEFGPATPADTDPAGGAHQHAEPDLGLTFWLARA